MEWTERNRYQASWGAWYVQTEIGWQVVEWKFDHSPTLTSGVLNVVADVTRLVS